MLNEIVKFTPKFGVHRSDKWFYCCCCCRSRCNSKLMNAVRIFIAVAIAQMQTHQNDISATSKRYAIYVQFGIFAIINFQPFSAQLVRIDGQFPAHGMLLYVKWILSEWMRIIYIFIFLRFGIFGFTYVIEVDVFSANKQHRNRNENISIFGIFFYHFQFTKQWVLGTSSRSHAQRTSSPISIWCCER